LPWLIAFEGSAFTGSAFAGSALARLPLADRRRDGHVSPDGLIPKGRKNHAARNGSRKASPKSASSPGNDNNLIRFRERLARRRQDPFWSRPLLVRQHHDLIGIL